MSDYVPGVRKRRFVRVSAGTEAGAKEPCRGRGSGGRLVWPGKCQGRLLRTLADTSRARGSVAGLRGGSFGGGSMQVPDTAANGRPAALPRRLDTRSDLDELRRDSARPLGVRLPCDPRAPGAARIVVAQRLRERVAAG